MIGLKKSAVAGLYELLCKAYDLRSKIYHLAEVSEINYSNIILITTTFVELETKE